MARSPRGRLADSTRLSWGAATLGVALVLLAVFGMHCLGDTGLENPDLCVAMLAALTIVLLTSPLVTGRLGLDAAPALVPAALTPLDLPPRS